MRAFVSVAAAGADPKLTGPPAAAPLHLTLAFLGEVAEDRSGALVATVAGEVATRSPFDMVLSGYGAFPNSARPRIVFREVGKGAEELTQLAAATRRVLERDGFEFDRRPFVPHVTVWRVRRPSDVERARSLLATAPGTVPVRVEEVLVNASRLDRAGATHTVIGRCPLARAIT